MCKIVSRLPVDSKEKVGNRGKSAALSGLVRSINNVKLRLRAKLYYTVCKRTIALKLKGSNSHLLALHCSAAEHKRASIVQDCVKFIRKWHAASMKAARQFAGDFRNQVGRTCADRRIVQQRS